MAENVNRKENSDPGEATMYTEEDYNKVAQELKKVNEEYKNLVNAFNKLLKEYNELHLDSLFK